jgi:hypothetical protein
MRVAILLGASLALIIGLLKPSTTLAQTATTPVYAAEAHRPRQSTTERLPAVPVVTDRIVTQRVVTEPPVAADVMVTDRAAVRPAVITPPVTTPRTTAWWEAFTQSRYGYYNDAYVDDNWFYDYYSPPTTAVVSRPVTGYRTGWLYEPMAERGLFNW